MAQVVARMDTAGYNDRQTMRAVLTDRENRYLVRTLCWVFLIEGLETYLLVPRDPADFDLLVEQPTARTRVATTWTWSSVCEGPSRHPTCATACRCQSWRSTRSTRSTGTRSSSRSRVPRVCPRHATPPSAPPRATCSTSFLQLADNAGATDEHRALNYLMLRSPSLRQRSRTLRPHWSFTGVEVRPSAASGVRNLVDVVCRPASGERRGGEGVRSRRCHRGVPRSSSASSPPTTRGEAADGRQPGPRRRPDRFPAAPGPGCPASSATSR